MAMLGIHVQFNGRMFFQKIYAFSSVFPGYGTSSLPVPDTRNQIKLSKNGNVLQIIQLSGGPSIIMQDKT